MNEKQKQLDQGFISRGAILLIGLLCLSAWGREQSGPVTPNQVDPNSFEKSHANQMYQNVKSRLWQSRIDALREKPDPDKTELRDLIRRLNAVRVKKSAAKTVSSAQKVPVTSSSAQHPVPVSDSNRPVAQASTATRSVAPKEPSGPLSAATLKIIAQVQESNEPVGNPLELAEMLYAHGYRSLAKVFYAQALRRADPNGPLDKAWVLLQLGNCSKDKDPVEAKRYYSQVVTNYADSPWGAMAKMQLALVQLYIDDRPEALLRDSHEASGKPTATPNGP